MVLSIKVTKGPYSSNGCSQIRPRMAKWNLELGFMDVHGLHMGTFSSQLGSLGSVGFIGFIAGPLEGPDLKAQVLVLS